MIDFRRAVVSYTLLTLVTVCSLDFAVTGLPIGGIMARRCVSVAYCAQEHRWKHNHRGQLEAGFRLLNNRCTHTLPGPAMWTTL